MAQDFWASSGFRLLRVEPDGVHPTAEWFAAFLQREELMPPADAGLRERALHARLLDAPLATVTPAEIDGIEDADARDNWREYLRFRDRLAAAGTFEACYRDLFSRAAVDLAPAFVDTLAQVIVRALLEGSPDAWLCRAGEVFFRRQRVALEGGRVLCADAETIQVFAETGGFGNLGRLLRQQNTPVPAVRMDVLNHENAPFYFLRDELYSFVLDVTAGNEGAEALARVLEGWVRRLTGAAVRIEPLARVEDPRWRWHVGLDVEASRMLDKLFRGEELVAAERERLALLFRLTFADASHARPELEGAPVYLGIACREDRTLRLKPQNLLANLPLAAVH